MEEFPTHNNLNFKRAMYILENRANTPSYLFAFWRIIGSTKERVPEIEKCHPWYSGLEKYIVP